MSGLRDSLERIKRPGPVFKVIINSFLHYSQSVIIKYDMVLRHLEVTITVVSETANPSLTAQTSMHTFTSKLERSRNEVPL